MKKIITFLRNSHEHIFKVMLAVLTIVYIVYLFPKEAKFQYEFQQGKPWLHQDLIAPFDFAIYKTEDEINRERQEIMTNATPYFKVHSSIPEILIQTFRENFAAANPTSQKKFLLETGENIIRDIYGKGIIKIDDVIDSKPDDFSIITLENNVAEERELSDVYTLQTAFQYTENLLNEKLHAENEKIFLRSMIENALIHNIFYDKETTDKIINEKLYNLSLTKGKVEKDVGIISKGEIVTGEKNQELLSLKMEYEKHAGGEKSALIAIAGQTIIVFIIIFLMMAFLYLFRKDIIHESNKVAFLLIMVALMVTMAIISLKIQEINIYALPFCILPILLRTFYDTRLATFTYTLTIILIGFLAPNGFEFVFIELVAGIAAIFSIVNLYNRSQLFTTSFFVFIAYCISYFGIIIIHQGHWEKPDLMNFTWFGTSAMLTLFAYPLMYVFERMFGFLSDVSLMELSNTNSPLLRKLAENAPGTFQHSLQVANIAEDLIQNIGGNPLFVRTGALYHDIGKLENPVFYSENQQAGINPHQQLKSEESAQIIIQHVIKGVEMAKKHKLPEPIIDFIRTHHGTTKTRYFYENYKNEHPGEEVEGRLFTYPGPIPFSKEGAVLMMADSVEAASRSLKRPTAESISRLVDEIINQQIADNQFNHSNITFRDISEIKKLLKRKLMNIYHMRIEYPKG